MGILPGKSRVEGESGGTQEEKVAPAACLSTPAGTPLSRASGVGLLVLVRSNFFEDSVWSCCHRINFITYWHTWNWISIVNP